MIGKTLPAAAGVGLLLAIASCHHPHHLRERSPAKTPEAHGTVEPEVGAATDRPDVRPAIERGLPVLQTDGDAWMEGRAPFQNGDACVSCHQVPYGVWGLEEAARSGIVADGEAATDLKRRAFDFVGRPGTGRPMSWSPLVLALGEDGSTASGFVDGLLDSQRSAGLWEARGQFPAQRRELSETNAVATMFTILALADSADNDEAVAASLERASAWVVERGPGKSTEWLSLRALVETRRGDREKAAELFHRLVDQQNEDGGWSWNPGEESNAMSTGEALYALSFAPSSAAAPEWAATVDRGLGYLIATQGEDGWWRVASDLTSRGRKDSKDYVYDYWGTAWATIGLARWHEADAEEMG